MLDQQDPWLAIGDPVEHEPAHMPRIPAQSANTQAPAGAAAQPAPDAFSQVGQPVQPGDHSTTTADAMEGGFADSRPYQSKASFPDAAKAHLSALYREGSASDIVQFLTANGFHSDPGQVALFVQQREDAKKHGGRVNYGVPIPSVPDVSAMKPGDLPADLQPGAAQAGGRGVASDIPGIKHITALTRTLDSKLGLAHPTDRSFGDELNYQEDLGHGVEQSDEANHPWARVSGQLLGGLAVPTGLEGMGLKVGTDVLKTGGTMAEARAAVKVAIRNRMATVNGTYGALHGAGEADTPGGAVTGALTEGALAAATGSTMGQIAPETKTAAQRAAPALTDAQQVAQAAERQGIDILPADVGGPVSRRATSMIAQTIAGGQPVISAAKRAVGQVGARRDSIADTVGHALQPEAAGNQARDGALKYIGDSAAQARGYYSAAETASNGVRLDAPKAIEALDQQIADLSEVPGGAPGLATLQSIRGDLAKGNLTVGGLRSMRTVLRDQFIKDGLRGSDLERRVGIVTDAAAQDVTQGLIDAGKPDAAKLLARGDAAWRERINTIDTVLKPIIGSRSAPRSGEQIIKSLTADLQGNNARAIKFLKALPPEEQANTRASIIGSLGHAANGSQNAAGDAFSLPTFLKNWNSIGESAKNAYFGPEARSALNDLAKVAEGAGETQKFANKSNTGGVVGNLMTMASSAGGVVSFIGANAAEYGLGRLLASPRFARWLARAPKSSLSTPAYVDRLSRIARAEPAIANEVLQLQQRLESAFTGSSMPTRLAAQEPSNEPDGGQGNAGEQQPQNEGSAATAPAAPPANDQGYHEWLNKYGIREDPTYDTRAAYQSGLKPDSRGHLNDEYKLPNHPTFSDESIHNGEGGKQGGKWVQTAPASSGMSEGTWTFKASPWNLQNMSKQHLKEYFDRVEPGMTIIFPDGEHYTGKDTSK